MLCITTVIPAKAGIQSTTKHTIFLPFAKRRGRGRSTQGMPDNHHPRNAIPEDGFCAKQIGVMER